MYIESRWAEVQMADWSMQSAQRRKSASSKLSINQSIKTTYSKWPVVNIELGKTRDLQSFEIRIVMPDSIRDSIRMQMPNSQVRR